MKKNLLGWLAMATMLVGTGCSSDEVVNDYSPENAIQFGTYVGRDAEGRASVFETSDMYSDGFGVYAYYTGTTSWADYADKGNPNFMNNTKVTSSNSGTSWEYTPVKYWPNNTGDQISFFAYAPWQDGSGNIKLNTSKAALDFIVQNDVTKQTDLTWNSTDHMNETKKATNAKISFVFRHALARIDFTLQAAADQVDAGGEIADGTTITLDKIVLGTTTNGFYTGGTLDLTKENATWFGSTLTGRQAFELTDANFVANSNVLKKGNNNKAGLIDPNGDDYIMIIPQEKTNLEVYVEYTVTTTDSDTTDGVDDSFTIVNKITKTIDEIDFVAGKAYTLNLVLGMSTVDLTASVALWENGTPEETTVDLPINTQITPA